MLLRNLCAADTGKTPCISDSILCGHVWLYRIGRFGMQRAYIALIVGTWKLNHNQTKNAKYGEEVIMRIALSTIALLTMAALVLPASAFASQVVLEGTVKGANAVIQGEVGPESSTDPLVAIERDFVLTTGRSYYFLTNVSRARKIELIGKQLKVIGEKSPMGIFVERIESLDGKLLYSWERDRWPEEDYTIEYD